MNLYSDAKFSLRCPSSLMILKVNHVIRSSPASCTLCTRMPSKNHGDARTRHTDMPQCRWPKDILPKTRIRSWCIIIELANKLEQTCLSGLWSSACLHLYSLDRRQSRMHYWRQSHVLLLFYLVMLHWDLYANTLQIILNLLSSCQDLVLFCFMM